MASRLNPANVITLGRIVACPVVAALAMASPPGWRLAAFFLFLAAALSDLWDGYLARRHGWVTDMGKLLDPLADKLLLVATFIPIYLLSNRPDGVEALPLIGGLPLWVLAIVFGRELFITGLRWWASRRGRVIAAGRSGKYKALFQNLFAGGALLWFPLLRWVEEAGATGTASWRIWQGVHGGWLGVTLTVAIVLTLGSMVDYLRGWRSGEDMSGAAGEG